VQEVETFLTIAERLKYDLGESGEVVIGLCEEVTRLLAGLRRSLI
jgi:hypothetical protein